MDMCCCFLLACLLALVGVAIFRCLGKETIISCTITTTNRDTIEVKVSGLFFRKAGCKEFVDEVSSSLNKLKNSGTTKQGN